MHRHNGLAHLVMTALCPLLLLVGREALAADGPMPTIFFSPAERAALEAARSPLAGGTEIAVREEKFVEETKIADEAPKSAIYTVSGLIRKGDGKSVAWVNGRPVMEMRREAGQPSIRVTQDHVVIDGKALKVGDSVDMLSGERVTRLPAGAVRVLP